MRKTDINVLVMWEKKYNAGKKKCNRVDNSNGNRIVFEFSEINQITHAHY